MSDTNYITVDTFERLKTELQHMKGIERPLASKAIGEAREKRARIHFRNLFSRRRFQIDA